MFHGISGDKAEEKMLRAAVPNGSWLKPEKTVLGYVDVLTYKRTEDDADEEVVIRKRPAVSWNVSIIDGLIDLLNHPVAGPHMMAWSRKFSDRCVFWTAFLTTTG